MRGAWVSPEMQVSSHKSSFFVLVKMATFLVFAVGLLFVFVIPPFQVPDENEHWKAANSHVACSVAFALPDYFEVQRIRFRSDQSFNTGLFRAADKNLTSTCDSKNKAQYAGQWSYPGVPIARLLFRSDYTLGSTAIQHFYLSRLIHFLLMFLGLLRMFQLAEKSGGISPGHLTLACFCLSPLFLQQSIGISADVTLNLFALSAASCWLYSKQFGKWDLCVFALWGFCAVSTKPILLPLLVPFWICAFLNKTVSFRAGVAELKSESLFKIGLGVVIAMSIACFYFALKGSQSIPEYGSVQPRAQLAHVISQPWESLKLLTSWVFKRLEFPQWIGPLGWKDLEIDRNTFRTWRAFLLVAICTDICFGVWHTSQKRRLGSSQWNWPQSFASIGTAFSLFFLAFCSCLMVALALYLGFTQVGATFVRGIQTRYFFPMILMMIPVFCTLVATFIASMIEAVNGKGVWLGLAAKASAGGSHGRTALLLPKVLLISFSILYGVFCFRILGLIASRYW